MKRKGAVYKKMLLSFIAVFCLPLMMAVLFYFYSGNIMEKQMELSSTNLMHTVRSVCDQEIEFYKNILRKYATDSIVKDLSRMEKFDSSKMSYSELDDITELHERLRDSAVSMDKFDGVGKELFVYFPKMGYMFTNHGGLTMFSTYLTNQFQDCQEDIEPLLEQLSVRSVFSSSVLQHTSQGEQMLLLTRTSWLRREDCEATVGIWLDIDELSDSVFAIDWEYGFEWLILDGNGNLLKGTKTINSYNEAFDLTDFPGMDQYYVSTIDSENTDWTYVILLPREIVNDSVGQIRAFFFISLALSLLLAYFLLRKIIVMNYAPLQTLMESFQVKRSRAHHKKDEYQFLQEQITTLISTKSSLEREVSHSINTVKRLALVNLLVKPFIRQERGDLDEDIRALDRGQNMVMLIKEKTQPDSNDMSDVTDDMKNFIIDNIFNEKIGELCHCEMVDLDNHQVMIVHDSQLLSKESGLWEIVYDLQQFVCENFGFCITVSGGGIHDNLEGIRESYLEACEAEEFIPVLEQDCIDYDDVRDNTLRRYDYSMQAEERIISAIQKNNAELATAFIDKILEMNFIEGQNSSNMRRCLLNDLYCTLLKAADQKDCIDRIDVTQHSFVVELSLAELKAKFARVVQRICNTQESQTDAGTDKELCQRVLAYVRENYQNKDLNISQTAQHFHMSPSNLSAIYKKETGKSLLKVINEVRIENAVEFLAKGYSVIETAEKVGISESSSFIRLFKKHMGVTPGQMKTRVQSDTDDI